MHDVCDNLFLFMSLFYNHCTCSVIAILWIYISHVYTAVKKMCIGELKHYNNY